MTVLALLTVLVALATFPDNNLHILACDVGQGDAFIIWKGTTQIVIDGGPNNTVLQCLGKHMPFWDRNIEAIVLSHPQQDHYYGLVEIFKRYKVANFIASDINVDSDVYKNLVSVSTNAKRFYPNSDMIMRVGNMSFKILWPSKEYFEINKDDKSIDTNNFSVVLELYFQHFRALFTGDLPSAIEDQLVGALGNIDYLKVPHHGSKTSLNENFLDEVSPKIAVISSGNKYGHPHQEVIDMLNQKHINIQRTAQKAA